MLYSVVHFFEDESVEAVPNFWIKGNTCAWPKNANTLRNTLKLNVCQMILILK